MLLVLGGLSGPPMPVLARPVAGPGPLPHLFEGDVSTSEVSEYQAKAAFLFNFIRYTTWPKDSFSSEKAPFVVLVVGRDRFGKHLDETFEEKKLHGRDVVIRRVKELPEKIHAHLVFTEGLDEEDDERVIKRCSSEPILLVGPESGYAANGATANFYLHKKKVRFEMNPDAIRHSRLEVSSELLKLAKIVRGEVPR